MKVSSGLPTRRLHSVLRRHEVGAYVVAVFVIGVFVRLLLLSRVTLNERPEPVQVALSLIENGAYADAFGRNVGPTAHCLPLHPLILAGVFRIFGSGTSGFIAISILASTSAALAYALLPALSVACGLGTRPGFFAGITGALIPVNFWAQTNGTFEAPYTALALVGLCCLVSRCWILESFRVRDGVRIGILGGLACLLNASVILVLAAWLMIGVWQFRGRPGHFVRFSVIVALLIVATLAPWAIRNYLVFGRLIWTRSNFGLELATSNSDYATANADTTNPAYRAHHPSASAAELEKLTRMGELQYNDDLKKRAFEWITTHPSRFVRLCSERVFFFWFPSMLRSWQTMLEAILTLLAFCGATSLIRTRNTSVWLIMAVLATYPLVYYIVEASSRYRYPIEPLLLLLGGYFLFTESGREFLWLRSPRSRSDQQCSDPRGSRPEVASNLLIQPRQ